MVWGREPCDRRVSFTFMMNVIQLKTNFEKMNFSYCNCFRTYYMYLK